MSKKTPGWLIKLLVFVISGLVGVLAMALVSVELFFDQVIYKKSPLYGYSKTFWMAPEEHDNPLISARYGDVLGLVNEETPGDHDKEEYEVVVLGDSVAFGVGVLQWQAFPEILGKKLNEVRPTRVVNLSISGDSIVDHYAKYLLAKQRWKADLFVLTLVDNDFFTDDVDKYPGERRVFEELKRSCDKPVFEYGWPDPTMLHEGLIRAAYYPSISEGYANRCMFEKVLMRMDMSKVLVLQTVPDEEFTGIGGEENRKYKEVVSLMGKLVSRSGGLLVDPFENGAEYKRVSKVEEHPDKKTHELYAQAIYDEIVGNEKWGFVR